MSNYREVFQTWYEDYYEKTVASRTALQLYRDVERHVMPRLGHLQIHQITPNDVLKLGQHIAMTSTSYANRLIANVVRVLDYAVIILRLIDTNPIHRVASYLPKHKEKGMSFVEFARLPHMLRSIDRVVTSHPVVQDAFWTIVYTGLRRSEVTQARKSEINHVEKTWTIPAQRMKTRQNGDHVIPLSSQVLAIIERNWRSGSDYVFVSPTKAPNCINTWTPYYLLRKHGWYKHQTLHGFRKIFSTHAHESGLWTVDAIELSLGHAIRGVRGIYNHTNMMRERKKLMQWYADEVDRWRL